MFSQIRMQADDFLKAHQMLAHNIDSDVLGSSIACFPCRSRARKHWSR